MNESVFLLNGRYVISLYTEDMNVCSLILLHKDRSDTEWIKFKRIPYIWDNMYRKIYVAEVPTELFEKLIVPIPMGGSSWGACIVSENFEKFFQKISVTL